MAQTKTRPFNYANSDRFGGAKLYRGAEWIGTVWLSVGDNWSWCLVCHPARQGGGASDFDDGMSKLMTALADFDANPLAA